MANQKNAPVDRRKGEQLELQFEEIPPPLEFRRLLTVREVAEILALKVGTVRMWVSQRRRFPVVRCGRSIRIPEQAVAEFIEQNTIPAREERRAR